MYPEDYYQKQSETYLRIRPNLLSTSLTINRDDYDQYLLSLAQNDYEMLKFQMENLSKALGKRPKKSKSMPVSPVSDLPTHFINVRRKRETVHRIVVFFRFAN